MKTTEELKTHAHWSFLASVPSTDIVVIRKDIQMIKTKLMTMSKNLKITYKIDKASSTYYVFNKSFVFFGVSTTVPITLETRDKIYKYLDTNFRPVEQASQGLIKHFGRIWGFKD